MASPLSNNSITLLFYSFRLSHVAIFFTLKFQQKMFWRFTYCSPTDSWSLFAFCVPCDPYFSISSFYLKPIILSLCVYLHFMFIIIVAVAVVIANVVAVLRKTNKLLFKRCFKRLYCNENENKRHKKKENRL